MQMYRGLPILTNQMPLPERRGIPHHLLDHIDLEQEPWVVGDFKRQANRIIGDIFSRGNLPIVVGGTHYYTNGLLFDDVLLPQAEDYDTAFPILDEPTSVLLAKLKEVDPVMADQWHPNDRRKIKRSLEIYLRTGRRASETYAEQRQRKASEVGDRQAWETLLFWVYSDPEVLKPRLDIRVDKMLDTGLLQETQRMFKYLQARLAAGHDIDMTRGIWQTIGFKEFLPYLTAVNEPHPEAGVVAKVKSAAIEDMKSTTRQYAKYQNKWIKKKLLPLLKRDDNTAMDHLFVLDSSDIAQWAGSVVEPAVSVTEKFLGGLDMPHPASLSALAEEVLKDANGAAGLTRTPCRKVCELCQTTHLTEDQWQHHIGSRRHRRTAKNAKKTALVAVCRPKEQDGKMSREDDIAHARSVSPSPSFGLVEDILL
jgi:tRNA dimethylallyltransferase